MKHREVNPDQMTTEEKLDATGVLWHDLTLQAKSESPSWHAHVLRLRSERARSGVESFVDWERAKQMLRQTFEGKT
jgi:hypothetical protein